MHIYHSFNVGVTVEDPMLERLNVPLTCEQLALYPVPKTGSTIHLYDTLFKEQGPQFRQLRICEDRGFISGRPIAAIAHILGNLTHLELTDCWGAFGEVSVFQIIFNKWTSS